ncbi:unnamed protein product [Thelazia callipaeda]|uniref:Cyclin N-terminal domain-containing protein n=1 Tax=Thelazia callipaeda TaxID=103827 RepID=A0A0N5CV92_THECL|nr:unnamed protein product [Thelazia callipaeda]
MSVTMVDEYLKTLDILKVGLRFFFLETSFVTMHANTLNLVTMLISMKLTNEGTVCLVVAAMILHMMRSNDAKELG